MTADLHFHGSCVLWHAIELVLVQVLQNGAAREPAKGNVLWLSGGLCGLIGVLLLGGDAVYHLQQVLHESVVGICHHVHHRHGVVWIL